MRASPDQHEDHRTPAASPPEMGLVRRALAFMVDVVVAGALGLGGVACAWYVTGTDPWKAAADPASQVYLGGVWVVALGAYLVALRGRTVGRRLLRPRPRPAPRPEDGGHHHSPRHSPATPVANPLVRQVAAQVEALSASEVDSVRRFVAGREQLTAAARDELARRLADGLRAKLPALSPADCPDAGVLLDVVYAALRMREDGARAE